LLRRIIVRAILEDYGEIGAEVWKRFKRGRNEQLWYFEELINVYAEICPNWRIVRELKRTVNNSPRFPQQKEYRNLDKRPRICPMPSIS
jgi:hypothetical protein